MKILVAAFLVIFVLTSAFAQNEQAEIVNKEINYKEWKYPSVKNETETELRQLIKGKKLVMVVYFAAWCPNWKHDVKFVQELYSKYAKEGFGVIGIAEYDTLQATKDHIDFYNITFPTVYETKERDRSLRTKTQHAVYRQTIGDTRNWGSPLYVFIEPSKIEKGEVILKNADVVAGELIKEKAEKYVQDKLKAKSVSMIMEKPQLKKEEACSDGVVSAELKKP